MADKRKRSGVSSRQHGVSLCENDIPGSSGRKKSMNKYSVSPNMLRSGAQSQILCMHAIFMNLVYNACH